MLGFLLIPGFSPGIFQFSFMVTWSCVVLPLVFIVFSTGLCLRFGLVCACYSFMRSWVALSFAFGLPFFPFVRSWSFSLPSVPNLFSCSLAFVNFDFPRFTYFRGINSNFPFWFPITAEDFCALSRCLARFPNAGDCVCFDNLIKVTDWF